MQFLLLIHIHHVVVEQLIQQSAPLLDVHNGVLVHPKGEIRRHVAHCRTLYHRTDEQESQKRSKELAIERLTAHITTVSGPSLSLSCGELRICAQDSNAHDPCHHCAHLADHLVLVVALGGKVPVKHSVGYVVVGPALTKRTERELGPWNRARYMLGQSKKKKLTGSVKHSHYQWKVNNIALHAVKSTNQARKMTTAPSHCMYVCVHVRCGFMSACERVCDRVCRWVSGVFRLCCALPSSHQRQTGGCLLLGQTAAMSTPRCVHNESS